MKAIFEQQEPEILPAEVFLANNKVNKQAHLEVLLQQRHLVEVKQVFLEVLIRQVPIQVFLVILLLMLPLLEVLNLLPHLLEVLNLLLSNLKVLVLLEHLSVKLLEVNNLLQYLEVRIFRG